MGRLGGPDIDMEAGNGGNWLISYCWGDIETPGVLFPFRTMEFKDDGENSPRGGIHCGLEPVEYP